MMRDDLDGLARCAFAERFTPTPAPERAAGATYLLDLPNHNTGRLETFLFPVVHDVTDTPVNQALRRRQLEAAAARMSRGVPA
jgi:hypothetical protein